MTIGYYLHTLTVLIGLLITLSIIRIVLSEFAHLAVKRRLDKIIDLLERHTEDRL